MNTDILLQPGAVCVSACADKPAVLRTAASVCAGAYGLDADGVQTGLLQREKLGSSGFGRGVAIPHCHNEGISVPAMAIVRLTQPVDFDAADAMPVSLVLALVSPLRAGAQHLHALAAISRFTRDEALVTALFDAPDADALYAIATDQFLRDAA